ncbi:MAG TPA: family 10 glycosylhydrolase [Vicinamibacterales bacterium]|nr:family 10 glycosylhydrolase [Vicinamibacterales bacterium]
MLRFGSPRVSLLVCAVALLVIAATAPFRAAAPEQTRALWVTRTTLTSPESIKQMVTAAQAGGFNTLLVQVRGRGDAYYAGTLEPRATELTGKPSFDPLATVLAEAHAGGLKVHAWVAVNLVSSSVSLPASRDHVIYRAPEWLMVPRELSAEMKKIDLRSPAYVGRLARWTRAHSSIVEGLYTSPLHPAAQDHTAAVIGEIAAKYAIDGVHLDYVRFPNEDFDYSASAMEQFKTAIAADLSDREKRDASAREQLDPAAYPNLFPERWNDFRRSRLTTLVTKIRTAVKTARPGTLVSAAVVPDSQTAFNSRMQDWRGWLDQSLLDVVCPMAYTAESEIFQKQIAAARAYAGSRPVWAGIGAYQMSPAQTLAHIAVANKLGVAGIILFSYESLAAPPNSADSVTELGRAAFGTAPE